MGPPERPRFRVFRVLGGSRVDDELADQDTGEPAGTGALRDQTLIPRRFRSAITASIPFLSMVLIPFVLTVRVT